jgi:pyruvate-formate lyase-activating enzyme
LFQIENCWGCLRNAVVKHAGFPNWDRLLFHIDEAMSWETVRHLERMEPLLILIRNLAVQGETPEEITEAIEDIAEILQEVRQDLKQGKLL